MSLGTERRTIISNLWTRQEARRNQKLTSLKENVAKEPSSMDHSEKTITKKANSSLFPMSAIGRNLRYLPLLG